VHVLGFGEPQLNLPLGNDCDTAGERTRDCCSTAERSKVPKNNRHWKKKEKKAKWSNGGHVPELAGTAVYHL